MMTDKEIESAEIRALRNAQTSEVDLTKCSVYVTEAPCLDCTDAILKVGIRVVVHGGDPKSDDNIKDMIYKAKACFQ